MNEEQDTPFIVEEWMGASPGGHVTLKGRRCGHCDVVLWPPVARCEACGGADLAPAELGPDAELHSITTDWTGTFLGYPHLVGQVRFPEGTFVQGFVAAPIDGAPAIGAAVRLVPFPVKVQGTELVTYAFEPAGEQ